MTGPSPKIRKLVYARAGDCCEICGAYAYGGSVHHRRPRGMGGDKRPETNRPANLLLLCGSGTTGCHEWVERNRGEAVHRGLLVPRHAIPANTPVKLRLGWVYLDDEGNYEPMEGDAA